MADKFDCQRNRARGVARQSNRRCRRDEPARGGCACEGHGHIAQDKGGYAKEQSAEQIRKQQELMAKVVAESDFVITTALIPGRKAPRRSVRNCALPHPPATCSNMFWAHIFRALKTIGSLRAAASSVRPSVRRQPRPPLAPARWPRLHASRSALPRMAQCSRTLHCSAIQQSTSATASARFLGCATRMII